MLRQGRHLQSFFVAILFGFALSAIGARGKPLITVTTRSTQTVFGIVNILMRLAPIGAFGAMAFTVGKYGIAALGPLAQADRHFLSRFNFFFVLRRSRGRRASRRPSASSNFLVYIKEEVLLVLAISSSEPAIPHAHGEAGKTRLFESPCRSGRPHRLHLQHRRLQHLHDSRRPLRRAAPTRLYAGQQLTILPSPFSLLRASGVQGAAFIALVRHAYRDPHHSCCRHGTYSWD